MFTYSFNQKETWLSNEMNGWVITKKCHSMRKKQYNKSQQDSLMYHHHSDGK